MWEIGRRCAGAGFRAIAVNMAQDIRKGITMNEQELDTEQLARRALSARRNRRANMAKGDKAKDATAGNGNGRGQSFSFTAPTAKVVQLVGDFTRWQEKPINMQKGVDGIWRTRVELEPGMHPYRFLVDGQWHDDPACDRRVPNPYGGQDSICQIV